MDIEILTKYTSYDTKQIFIIKRLGGTKQFCFIEIDCLTLRFEKKEYLEKVLENIFTRLGIQENAWSMLKNKINNN